MPRCNNMSLRRTKSKVPMTFPRHFRNTGAYLSRRWQALAFRRFSALCAPLGGLDSPGKRTASLIPWPVPKNLDFDALLATAHALADRAGAVILPHFRTGFVIDHKGGDLFDPVTAADRTAEMAIREALAEVYPSHGIIGEEYRRAAPPTPSIAGSSIRSTAPAPSSSASRSGAL